MASVPHVIIIGGGLSGLMTASVLHSNGVPFSLLEARPRLGGRISSVRPLADAPAPTDKADAHSPFALDLGPAWMWPDAQPRLSHLVEELGVQLTPQYEDGGFQYQDEGGRVRTLTPGPKSYDDAMRFAHGVESLITGLQTRIPDDTIRLNAEVKAIDLTAQAGGVRVTLSNDETVTGSALVVAVPPRLAASMTWTPALPPELNQGLVAIPTWMAAHAKFLAVYDAPFWRDAGFSGRAASNRGPLVEVAEQSAPDGSFHALFGFIGWSASQRADRKRSLEGDVLAQLESLFGAKARHPVKTYFMDWATESFTAGHGDDVGPRGHPLYGGAIFERPWFDGRVAFAGTESSRVSGGLIEGAVLAGERAAAMVQSACKAT